MALPVLEDERAEQDDDEDQDDEARTPTGGLVDRFLVEITHVDQPTGHPILVGTCAPRVAPAAWAGDREAAYARRVRIAVTGSSGLIGSTLVGHLQRSGHDVLRIVRADAPAADRISWSPTTGEIDRSGLEAVDALIHLAGAGIADRRWTTARKRTIIESRTTGTDLLARTIAGLAKPPSVLISASAIGYYGDRGDELLTEESPTGAGFLAQVCRDWEAAARPARDAGIRVVHPRTGLVLSAEGGALAKQLPLFRAGLGGRLGSGRQWWSSISLTDEVRALEWLLEADVDGPVNLTGPESVTNAAFTATLGRVLSRPAFLAVPRFAPGLLLGSELARELLFASQRVLPARLEATGFSFTHPTLQDALEAELRSGGDH